jgi:hypothetical protein
MSFPFTSAKNCQIWCELFWIGNMPRLSLNTVSMENLSRFFRNELKKTMPDYVLSQNRQKESVVAVPNYIARQSRIVFRRFSLPLPVASRKFPQAIPCACHDAHTPYRRVVVGYCSRHFPRVIDLSMCFL